jgi:hypothetical protein
MARTKRISGMACCAGSVTACWLLSPSGSLAVLLLPLSQPDAGTAAVLLDELDAGRF